jgi:hypothetical protein
VSSPPFFEVYAQTYIKLDNLVYPDWIDGPCRPVPVSLLHPLSKFSIPKQIKTFYGNTVSTPLHPMYCSTSSNLKKLKKFNCQNCFVYPILISSSLIPNTAIAHLCVVCRAPRAAALLVLRLVFAR